MGTSAHRNWRLTVPTTTKMMLVRPPMTNLKMTVRDDVLFPHGVPPHHSVYKCSHLLRLVKEWGSWPLDRCPLPSPPVAGIWNKANFPFHQPGLFTSFWAASSWIPHAFLSVTGPGPEPQKTWLPLWATQWINNPDECSWGYEQEWNGKGKMHSSPEK